MDCEASPQELRRDRFGSRKAGLALRRVAFKLARMMDRITIPPAALWLGLAGALPFWAAAIAFAFLPDRLWGVFAFKAGLAYGAVILSFLGGIRWGEALKALGRAQSLTFSLSVLASLAGWVALLLPGLEATALLITGLWLQYFWDRRTVQQGALPVWFGKLRFILTTLASSALLLMFLRLLLGS